MKRLSVPRGLMALGGLVWTATECSDAAVATDASDDGKDVAHVDAVNEPFDAGTDAVQTECGVGDWADYVRYTAVAPCARVDTPTQPDASVPAMKWVTCATGLANCVEMQVSWPGDQGSFFSRVKIAAKADGTAAMINLWLHRDYGQIESCVYDFTSQAPITSWRYAGNLANDYSATVLSSASAAALTSLNFASSAWSMKSGTLSDLQAAPSLSAVPTTVIPPGTGVQRDDVSDTTYAFDVGTIGSVVRVPVGATSYVVGKTAGVVLSRPLVRGDDVFAYAAKGTDGWPRYYRVDADAGVVDYLVKTMHFLSGLAAMPTNVCWADAYGNSQPTTGQPLTEVWCAPYSADATTIASTGTKVASMSGGGNVGTAVAFNGYWAGMVGLTDLWIVRIADGKTTHLQPESKRQFEDVSYIDDNEVWVTERAVPGAGGVALERIGYSL